MPTARGSRKLEQKLDQEVPCGSGVRVGKCGRCKNKSLGWCDKSKAFFCEQCWSEYDSYQGEDGEDYTGKVWHDAILAEGHQDDGSGSDDDGELVMEFTKSTLLRLRPNQTLGYNDANDIHNCDEENNAVAPLSADFGARKAFDSLIRIGSGPVELQQAHIIVVVDTSGSMRTLDVQPEQGTKSLSRILAVSESLCGFFEKQKQAASPHHFSLVSFSQDSYTHFVGKTAAESVEYMNKSSCFVARDGTHFVESLPAVRNILRRDFAHTPHLLIFSDGRPADGTQKIQSVQRLLDEHPRLRIHAIGFGDGLDFEWLQQLTSIGKGTFAPSGRSVLELDHAFTSVTSTITEMQSVSSQTSKSSAFSFTQGFSGPDNASKKSSLTPRSFTFEAANQFLWNTERSIKFRSCRRLFRFNGRDFKQDSHELRESPVSMRLQPFMQGGMRLVYCFKDPSIRLHSNRTNLTDTDARMVAKISKYVDNCHNSSEVVMAYAKSSAVAKFYARIFKLAAVERFGSTGNGMLKLMFVTSYVYKAEEDKAPAPFVIGERFLPGVFCKYNSNHGYVNFDAPDSEIAQAFSHFTFQASGGKHMVLDLQGVYLGKAQRYRPHLILTDPQVVSLDKAFGPGDLGDKGMRAFFQSHQCGPTCRHMGLDPHAWKRMRQAMRKGTSAGLTPSPSNSAVDASGGSRGHTGSISCLRKSDVRSPPTPLEGAVHVKTKPRPEVAASSESALEALLNRPPPSKPGPLSALIARSAAGRPDFERLWARRPPSCELGTTSSEMHSSSDKALVREGTRTLVQHCLDAEAADKPLAIRKQLEDAPVTATEPMDEAWLMSIQMISIVSNLEYCT